MVKTQTYETNNPSTIETETLPKSSWDDIGQYVTSLTNEPDFISHVEEQGFSKGTIEYADALSRYAETEVSRQGELVDEQSATQILLTASAPYITHVSMRINELKELRDGGKLPKNEWDEFNSLKAQTVWYNQMLSDYMYTYNDDSFSAISQTMVGQVLDHLPSRSVEPTTTIGGIIGGARTEAATRHLLDAIPAPYRPATPEEDLHGADLVLMFSGEEYYVDIKRSLNKLAENNGGYSFEQTNKTYAIDSSGPKKKILFFPGFTDNDLGDSLRLNAEITNERKIIIGVQLMRAIREIDA